MGMMIHAHVDGACRPNPGQMSAGVVLQVIGKDRIIREGFFGKPFGKGSNQLSELLAIKLAVDSIEGPRREHVHLVVFSDSMWAVKRLKAEWLGEAHEEVVAGIRHDIRYFKSFAIYHSSETEHLEKAHKLAQRALREGEFKEIREYTSELMYDDELK